MSVNNAQLIENAVVISLPTDTLASEDQLRDLGGKLRSAFPVSDEEFELLLKRLHAKLAISMDVGVQLVEEDHVPWLSSRKPSIDPFYFDRFSKLMQKRGWPPKVSSTLDKLTDEVLDLCGDPGRSGHWKRRGLVMGDVQSGKTATYTALSCKAADAGYRLIILLTGTLESLRRQTQERLDEGFVGLDSSEKLTTKKDRLFGVGTLDRRRFAGVFTSRTNDFSRDLLNQLGFRLDAFHEPVLVVVKKNKHVLENLANWLSGYNAGRDGKIDAPLLLIDDEADNASVNTAVAGNDPTSINLRIRSLLNLFTRSTYIGFTATPFANVFIDPETPDEMIGHDLFPRDFIYCLEPPTNYIGPATLFGDDASLASLRTIEDAGDIFPPRHKSLLQIHQIPHSLRESVLAFILATTIRDLRGEGPSHRSMLVNVSRFTAVQEQVARFIDEELRSIQRDIRNFSQLTEAEALANDTIARLRETWQREFCGCSPTWSDVQHGLLQSALPIEVRAVNQRTGASSLDYSTYRETGLRVIAVGGNSLSRGLTLEGLTTSYFYRNSEMYDTLLQMGRWFGYRDGYADLCRLYLTDEAQHWYAHISSATQELREEIRIMRNHHRTPKDFGLKVRAHPDSLIVTARNKMRTAKTVERIISISGEGLETPKLRTSEQSISNNASAVRDFLNSLDEAGFGSQPSPFGTSKWWPRVPKTMVSSLLRKFDCHPLNVAFQADDLASFIETTDEPKLQDWDIAIPGGSSESPITLANESIRPLIRKVEVDEAVKAILVSGSKARVGSRGVEKEGIPPEEVREAERAYKERNPGKSISDKVFRAIRSRPLLLIYVIEAYTTGDKPFKPSEEPLIALGLSFPTFNDANATRRVKYNVNLVEWKRLFETEIDDEELSEDDQADKLEIINAD